MTSDDSASHHSSSSLESDSDDSSSSSSGEESAAESIESLPSTESYAEIIEAADAQMVSTTAPTQCDSLVNPDAVREALKGSEFEKLLEC